MTDNEIILKHDQGCRPRARMELAIVNALIGELARPGYTAKIDEYGNEPTTLKDGLFNLDEAHLIVFKDGKKIGFVYLVFGNDGHDLISDYSVSLEEFLKPVNEVADKLANGLL